MNSSAKSDYLIFYSCLQDRRVFESELVECFGSLVKMPLLEPNRSEWFTFKILYVEVAHV